MCNCRKKNKVIVQPTDVNVPAPQPTPAPALLIA